MFSYYMPTRIYFGTGALDRLGAAVSSFAGKKVLIFIGGKSAEISGALGEVQKRLSGHRVVIFGGIKANPSIGSLSGGIERCREEVPDCIIAIGGGSVIDYAKAVSLLCKEKGPLSDFFYKKYSRSGQKIRVAAVPTTFGTSSEVTPYAVMTDEDKQNKVTLTDEAIMPEYAFTDPQWTLTMPRPLIAASCADLLSHALEAYWNVNATELTDNFAASAIRLFLESYRRTYQKPRNLQFREKISLASIYAGLAFSHTKTTVCHSLSYPLTTVFQIPHGIACALSLGEMLSFNAQAGRKISALCRIMGCKGIRQARKKMDSILNNLNLKTRLRDYGLAKSDLAVVLDKGFTPEKMRNNPRKVDRDDLKKILERLY